MMYIYIYIYIFEYLSVYACELMGWVVEVWVACGDSCRSRFDAVRCCCLMIAIY